MRSTGSSPSQAVSHGEQVGLGAAFASFLRGSEDVAVELATFLRRHGLPVLPSDIGLDVDQFTEAALFAPRTRPGRYTILEHLDLGTEEMTKAVEGYIATVTDDTDRRAGTTPPRAQDRERACVSVVIPVYNTRPYLAECLDSVLTQDLSPDELEVVAVDDGSTDGSGELLDAYAERHRNLRVIHQDNSGWPGRPAQRRPGGRPGGVRVLRRLRRPPGPATRCGRCTTSPSRTAAMSSCPRSCRSTARPDPARCGGGPGSTPSCPG